MHLNKIGGLALACLLTAGSLAACSSTKKTTVDAAGKTTTTTAATSSGGASGGSSSGGSLSAEQCTSAGAAYGKVVAGAISASTGNTAGLSDLQGEYDTLGASIPDSLKADYDTVGKAYTQFEKDLQGVSMTDPSSMGKVQKAESNLTAPDVQAAAKRINAYFQNGCQS